MEKNYKKEKMIDSIKNYGVNLNLQKIFLVIIGIMLIFSIAININYLTKTPKVIEKEVVLEKEIVKYVEKQGGTPTDKFIIYLNSRIDPITAKIIAKAVDESSKKYSLPRKLVLSIINKESFFNPLSKSHKNCVGLMQINPPQHKEKVKGIPKTHLYHIGINIDIGCKIFREYFDKSKGDLHKTFHSYLGKGASKQRIDKYKNDILYTFAGLEMYEYIVQKEKEKENGKKIVNIINNPIIDGVLPESD